MDEAIFTGKFLKPAEVFAVQHLDPTHLHRLAPDLFYWVVALGVAGLAIHFVLQALPGVLGRKERR